MMFSDDIVEQFAMGHAYIGKSKKCKETSTLKPNGRKPLAKTKQNNATNNNHKTPKLTKPQNQSCDLENKKQRWLW